MKLYQIILIVCAGISTFGCNAAQTTASDTEKPPENKNAAIPAENKTPETAAKITEPKPPVETVKALSEAVRTKDYETAKKLFSKKTLAELEKTSTIEQFVDTANKFYKGEPKTRSEKINGDKATLDVENLGEQETKWETMNFVKEDGLWKITRNGE